MCLKSGIAGGQHLSASKCDSFCCLFFFFNLYEMEQQDMGPGEDQMA